MNSRLSEERKGIVKRERERDLKEEVLITHNDKVDDLCQKLFCQRREFVFDEMPSRGWKDGFNWMSRHFDKDLEDVVEVQEEFLGNILSFKSLASALFSSRTPALAEFIRLEKPPSMVRGLLDSIRTRFRAK